MRELDLKSIPAGKAQTGLLAPSLGHPLEVPYMVVQGVRPGPTLLVTAGVHGAEYASIEAANRVAKILPEELSGTLIVLPVVNPPSFFARSIYINPVDGKNLNRVFPGKVEGSFAERLAHWLTEAFIAKADAYLDLHGGDLIESLTPFAIYQSDAPTSSDLGRAFGLPYLIAGTGVGTTYATGNSCDVPSVLAEAGGQGQWPEHEVERLVKGVRRAMQYLGMLQGKLEPRKVKEFTTFAWLCAEGTGFWYPSVTAGMEVEPGQPLGVVTDVLGEIVQHVVSPLAGPILFGTSSLAINRDDPLAGIAA